MSGTLSTELMTVEKDRGFARTLQEEKSRLLNFIRGRVRDESDAEDIFQEVFYEFLEANRLPEPIEQAGAWLFRVARNRIIDLFRKKRSQSLNTAGSASESPAEGETLEDLLPSLEAGPEAAYARAVLLEQIEDALDELPPEQREAFLVTEVEGLSFKEFSAQTGVGVNTLLSRKHYAVVHLRERLREIYEGIQA